jgi:sugar phosphate isomerase/epimerase
MNDRLHVHVPYEFLRENLELVIATKVNPEVYFPGEMLDRLIPEQLSAIAKTLSNNRIATTIHAPFMDLNPGSTERLLMEATQYRFRQVMEAAAILKPRAMVFHPGYDRWRYGDNKEKWLDLAVETFTVILQQAATIGTVIAVENIFEEEPSTLKLLLDRLPDLRHCFDVGHWNLFKKVGMEEWFASIGSRIAEVHIHDNRGSHDDHSPVGEGEIDFSLFFRLMKEYAPQSLWTIEAHSKEDLFRSLEAIKRYL